MLMLVVHHRVHFTASEYLLSTPILLLLVLAYVARRSAILLGSGTKLIMVHIDLYPATVVEVPPRN